MRKNGSRLISLRQYRLTDLFLFAVILVVFDALAHFAPMLFTDGALFTFTLTVPIVLLIMMRWGWPCVFYAVGDGLVYCLLNLDAEGFHPALFAVFTIGNAFIMLLLLMTKFMGKEKIRGKWYFSVLFVVLGWLAVFLGRAIVFACFGFGFVTGLTQQIWDLLSLAIAIVLVLIFRRLDGMFEDQKHFLRRLDNERKEMARRDTYGDEPIEIDEESLSILKRKDDDLY